MARGLPVVILVLCLPVAPGRASKAASQPPRPKRFCQVAQPVPRPPGSPKPSDVIMRTLRLHPSGSGDPHDTMEAVHGFHVTRLEWAYVTDRHFIAELKAAGRLFGGAAAAPSYLPPPGQRNWLEKVCIVNLEGEPIIAPWKRTWSPTLWGCVNNPELERGYVAYLKRYLDAGAEVMQRDEPGANENATHWGGCFCDHCMEGFRRYLATHLSAKQQRELGLDDLDSFDYRDLLRRRKAPVGDAFGRWDGGRLKELFVEFQTQATIDFHRRTRQAMDDYAGRRVPVSCNNGASRWGPIEEEFDWVFGELSLGQATPKRLLRAIRAAAAHRRVQVVTMPKKGDRRDLDAWQRRTRRTIATVYAAGGLCMVPWDVYMPRDAPRYFGTPEQYADLYGLIRASAEYLDGYEDAALAVAGMEEARYGKNPPVAVGGGSGGLAAIVRAKPGREQAPVVVHLVEWGDKPAAAELAIRADALFGDRPIRARLRLPAPYDASRHDRAERTGRFDELVVTMDAAIRVEGDRCVVALPPIPCWALLVIAPGDPP